MRIAVFGTSAVGGCFIASFSGVGAVTRSPAGILRSLPETRQMLEQAMREILDVARAREIALPAGLFSSSFPVLSAPVPGAFWGRKHSPETANCCMGRPRDGGLSVLCEN